MLRRQGYAEALIREVLDVRARSNLGRAKLYMRRPFVPAGDSSEISALGLVDGGRDSGDQKVPGFPVLRRAGKEVGFVVEGEGDEQLRLVQGDVLDAETDFPFAMPEYRGRAGVVAAIHAIAQNGSR